MGLFWPNMQEKMPKSHFYRTIQSDCRVRKKRLYYDTPSDNKRRNRKRRKRRPSRRPSHHARETSRRSMVWCGAPPPQRPLQKSRRNNSVRFSKKRPCSWQCLPPPPGAMKLHGPDSLAGSRQGKDCRGPAGARQYVESQMRL
jgi:hypothetical protein